MTQSPTATTNERPLLIPAASSVTASATDAASNPAAAAAGTERREREPDKTPMPATIRAFTSPTGALDKRPHAARPPDSEHGPPYPAPTTTQPAAKTLPNPPSTIELDP